MAEEEEEEEEEEGWDDPPLRSFQPLVRGGACLRWGSPRSVRTHLLSFVPPTPALGVPHVRPPSFVRARRSFVQHPP